MLHFTSNIWQSQERIKAFYENSMYMSITHLNQQFKAGDQKGGCVSKETL